MSRRQMNACAMRLPPFSSSKPQPLAKLYFLVDVEDSGRARWRTRNQAVW